MCLEVKLKVDSELQESSATAILPQSTALYKATELTTRI